jgi:hypothetical protein
VASAGVLNYYLSYDLPFHSSDFVNYRFPVTYGISEYSVNRPPPSAWVPHLTVAPRVIHGKFSRPCTCGSILFEYFVICAGVLRRRSELAMSRDITEMDTMGSSPRDCSGWRIAEPAIQKKGVLRARKNTLSSNVEV